MVGVQGRADRTQVVCALVAARDFSRRLKSGQPIRGEQADDPKNNDRLSSRQSWP